MVALLSLRSSPGLLVFSPGTFLRPILDSSEALSFLAACRVSRTEAKVCGGVPQVLVLRGFAVLCLFHEADVSLLSSLES